MSTQPAPGRTRRRTPQRLRVDWPACSGRGLCAELLPDLVRLDEWGYPVLASSGDVPDDRLAEVKAAVRACPTLALRLVTPASPGR